MNQKQHVRENKELLDSENGECFYYQSITTTTTINNVLFFICSAGEHYLFVYLHGYWKIILKNDRRVFIKNIAHNDIIYTFFITNSSIEETYLSQLLQMKIENAILTLNERKLKSIKFSLLNQNHIIKLTKNNHLIMFKNI